jgi:hypothetical protein
MSAQPISSSIDLIAEKLYLVLTKEYEQLAHFLRTLREEQACIMDRRTQDLIELLPKIEKELNAIQETQKQREHILQKELSSAPSEKQPGIAARILNMPDSVKQRCHKVSRQVETELFVINEVSWQNQLLLSKSIHFLQTVLAPLLGTKKDEPLAIYGQRGKLQSEAARQSIFQGVG